MNLDRRYALACLLQAGIDAAVFFIAVSAGASFTLAHMLAFFAGAVPAFAIYFPKTVLDNKSATGASGGPPRAALLVIILAVFFLRGGLATLLNRAWGWPEAAVGVPVALVSAVIIFVGFRLWFAPWRPMGLPGSWPLRAAVGIIAYLALLRLVYIGLPNLIMEEAYYWNYSQHLDWGYLDHPPMVALIIRLGTLLFGQTEFGVRIGAWLAWLLTAYFGYKLAKAMFDKESAIYSVLLLAGLPFFFGAGCLMMPDGLVTACWAGALYFLYRALVQGKGMAWYAVGICLGCGLLSKYTIGLLIPATIVFVLWDHRARAWLTRPQPYLAVLLAAAFFTPVIYWNAVHGWASFLFQTMRRVSAGPHFSLHILLGSIMVLLTPTGLAAAAAYALDRGAQGARGGTGADDPAARRRFILILALIPLAVFLYFSLRHEPKLNWTGPLWLALLPGIAWTTTPAARSFVGRFTAVTAKAWMPTVTILIIIYGGFFHYLVLGFPGVPYPRIISDVAGWDDLGRQVGKIGATVKAATGSEPLVVGMDLYRISSEIAFYTYPDGPRQAAGGNLFGNDALMYAYWFPATAQTGKNIILVGSDAGQMNREVVTARFDSLSVILPLPVRLNSIVIGLYYYRVGFGYKAGP